MHNRSYKAYIDSTTESFGQGLTIDENKPSFWLLHCVGWAVYVVVFAFDNILFTYEMVVGFGVIVPLIGSGSIAFLLTLPLRSIYSRCWQLSPKKLVSIIIGGSFAVALIWTPTKNLLMWSHKKENTLEQIYLIATSGDFNSWGTLSSLSYSFFMIMVWSSLYFGINYHYRLIKEKQLHIEAVRLSHHAQIKMLRYQINPHFLFNTLNAVSTLVLQGQKEKANGMLVRLSTFLRFSLDNDPEKKIPLYDEIKACMLYLEIEKTRFEDRLSVDLQIQEEAECLLVPSLILQPLVENSIKYAIANMASGGVIKITANVQGKYLHLSVIDNGPKSADSNLGFLNHSEKENSGVGLNNIKDRLNVLYPSKHQFMVENSEDFGFEVKIAIPKELS